MVDIIGNSFGTGDIETKKADYKNDLERLVKETEEKKQDALRMQAESMQKELVAIQDDIKMREFATRLDGLKTNVYGTIRIGERVTEGLVDHKLATTAVVAGVGILGRLGKKMFGKDEEEEDDTEDEEDENGEKKKDEQESKGKEREGAKEDEDNKEKEPEGFLARLRNKFTGAVEKKVEKAVE